MDTLCCTLMCLMLFWAAIISSFKCHYIAFNELQICVTLPTHELCYVNRKAQESQKEMKLLLDMYKSAPKEQRDKVQLMAAEKKSKAEVCDPT